MQYSEISTFPGDSLSLNLTHKDSLPKTFQGFQDFWVCRIPSNEAH